MGCKNMIVAASNDGILVSDKETSGYMKPYVEKLGNMAMFAENHGVLLQCLMFS